MKQIIYNRLEEHTGEHRLGAWLVFTAMRLEALADRYMFKPFGLTTATFRILMALEKIGPQTPSDILNLLGSTKSNVTQRLSGLEKLRLIEISRGMADDRRRSFVSITKNGRKKINAVQHAFKKHDLHIEKFFNDKDTQQFLAFLRKLNQGIDKCERDIKKYYKQVYEN